MYDIKMLKAKKLAELIEIAEQIGLKDIKGMKKQDLIDAITKNPDQETSSVNTKPQLEENKQNNFEKDQEMDLIKLITIKTFQTKKKITLIKTIGGNIKNQILSLMELLNQKVF